MAGAVCDNGFMTKRHSMLARWFSALPIREWSACYDRAALQGDLFAAVIVTIMLIPQSLAYAMLAGLPPEAGLYASVVPLLAYAVFGSSKVLAVGPVAVVSLMTATAISQVATPGSSAYWEAAIILAFLSGLMLIGLGMMRLGFISHFLSQSVISGFISASGLLIAFSQLQYILGIKAGGHHVGALLMSITRHVTDTHPVTLVIGISATAFLFWTRMGLKSVLIRLGISGCLANSVAKAGPVAAIAVTSVCVWALGLDRQGVRIVGAVPQGLPPFTFPKWDSQLWQQLLLPAMLVSVIGFVESISIAQGLAAKRHQRIEPDQELIALGAGNVAASLSGGFPVTGGIARSAVNFDAGAQTPAAGVFTAIGLALASLYLTPALYYLPQATLAATIIVAVLSLVDFGILKRTWHYSKPDFAAVAGTLVATLVSGVETGLVIGVVISLALYLYRTSRPHIAEVGWVRGTEHFRNVLRHDVATSPFLLGLRVDESLYFANAPYFEDCIYGAIAARSQLRHVVLQCSAINDIDASALKTLETIERRLRAVGIFLHLSEVKGPVMDRLQNTDFLHQFGGRVFLTHYQAVAVLAPEVFLPANPGST